jgi:hypothetical protein
VDTLRANDLLDNKIQKSRLAINPGPFTSASLRRVSSLNACLGAPSMELIYII